MEIIVNLVIVGLISELDLGPDERRRTLRPVLMFFNVLFGALDHLSYEPLAKLLDGTGIGWGFSDTLCLLGLFIIATFFAADHRVLGPGH